MPRWLVAESGPKPCVSSALGTSGSLPKLRTNIFLFWTGRFQKPLPCNKCSFLKKNAVEVGKEAKKGLFFFFFLPLPEERWFQPLPLGVFINRFVTALLLTGKWDAAFLFEWVQERGRLRYLKVLPISEMKWQKGSFPSHLQNPYIIVSLLRILFITLKEYGSERWCNNVRWMSPESNVNELTFFKRLFYQHFNSQIKAHVLVLNQLSVPPF